MHDIPSPHLFREKLLWLKEHYTVVSLEELLSRTVRERTMVAITFDDGYASWHESVASILETLHLPATFFVCSGFIDLEGEKASQFVRTCLQRQQKLLPLTKNQLSDLVNHPLFEIGGHTAHHVNLGQVRDQNILEIEIEGDRKRLQDWIGEDIRWFAYPFGMKKNISREAVTFLEHSAFRAAFTFIPKFLTDDTNKFLIGRDGLEIEDPLKVWHAKLQGHYDFFYALKEGLLRKEL